jgi:hypothetical protein
MGRLDSEGRTAVAALLKKGHSPSAVARLLGGHGRSSSISSASPGDGCGMCDDSYVGRLTTNEMAGS